MSARERGICAACGKTISVRKDGTLMRHGPMSAPKICPGSERPPVPAPAPPKATKATA